MVSLVDSEQVIAGRVPTFISFMIEPEHAHKPFRLIYITTWRMLKVGTPYFHGSGLKFSDKLRTGGGGGGFR